MKHSCSNAFLKQRGVPFLGVFYSYPARQGSSGIIYNYADVVYNNLALKHHYRERIPYHIILPVFLYIHLSLLY